MEKSLALNKKGIFHTDMPHQLVILADAAYFFNRSKEVGPIFKIKVW